MAGFDRPLTARRKMFDARRLILCNKMYFPSPMSFNDPFDSRGRICFDGVTEAELKGFLRKYRRGKNASEDAVERDTQILLRRGIHNNPYEAGIFNDGGDKLVERRANRDRWGVICLSASHSEVLLWSHYADGHKGLCFQFSRDAFLRAKPSSVLKVTYRKELPTVREMNDMEGDWLTALLLRKAMSWAYEREYRVALTLQPANHRYVTLTPDMLTGVILGWQMAPRDKARVREWVEKRASKGSRIKVYEAKPNSSKYQIDVPGLDGNDGN